MSGEAWNGTDVLRRINVPDAQPRDSLRPRPRTGSAEGSAESEVVFAVETNRWHVAHLAARSVAQVLRKVTPGPVGGTVVNAVLIHRRR